MLGRIFMDHWFKLDLGDAMFANNALLDIKAHLSNVYEINSKPINMLAIYRHESKGLHCSLIVYLTTEFQQLAMLDNTISCNIPPLSDSGFLAGDEIRFHTDN